MVKDEFIESVVADDKVRDQILKKRIAFLPDDAWEKLKLPMPKPKEPAEKLAKEAT